MAADQKKSKDRTEFGQRMFSARDGAGLTQDFVCEQLGVAQSTLSGLETTAAGSTRVVEFAVLYNVSPLWLAVGDRRDDTVRYSDGEDNLKSPIIGEPFPAYRLGSSASGGRSRIVAQVPINGAIHVTEAELHVEAFTWFAAGGFVSATGVDPSKVYGLRVIGGDIYDEGKYLVIEQDAALVAGESYLIEVRDKGRMLREYLFDRQGIHVFAGPLSGTKLSVPYEDLVIRQIVLAEVSHTLWTPGPPRPADHPMESQQ